MNVADEKMVADAIRGSWVHRFLPQWLWPYAQLARWERPIGWWLLMWPCWWSLMLAVNWRAASAPSPLQAGLAGQAWEMVAAYGPWLALFTLGAIATRGAGCTYNDLVDQDIDDKVARTRSRPLPSGRVTRMQAVIFLALQLLLGLVVLLQFNRFTIALGVLSLVTVAIYPFMKRVTWWPQLFLGLAFSWGALMGWPALTSSLDWAPLFLYAGAIAWVIGYDTIYALQDIEDDALAGVKSTARLFAANARPAIAALYALALVLFVAAFHLAQVGWPAWLGLALGAAQMGWQIARLDLANPARCLRLFQSNKHFGWIVFAGLFVSALLASRGGM